ncbi:MAG: outer membrane protein [Candidatus Eremiobacteraeota bacterium]|jgi:Skp family chaperone for outer membrane proteins|nr:outer membrane protein [Candidatus Eremiobacteraeota bacterium]
MRRIIIATALLASLAACSGGSGPTIGLVDEERIKANWPKFLNYQNQLSNDAQSIERSNKPEREKQRLRAALQERFVRDQTELSNDVRDAAKQVVDAKHLTYVFTRQYVGYGGVDITPDVEKILKIEEKATPAP